MSVPEHLWRFHKREARISLAERFGLPCSNNTQDWEWEVADCERIDEFLESYETDPLTDDERFSLMDVMIQSFADLEIDLSNNLQWHRVLSILDSDIGLHIYQVWYWSGFEEDGDFWPVVPWLRKIREKYREEFMHKE